MNKHITNTLLLLFLPFISFAQLPANCSGNAPRMAIAGDSWAQYMADDNTHNRVLKMYGQADKTAVAESFEIGILCGGSTPGAGDYAVSGSLALQWADETNYPYLQDLIDALNAQPTIDMVLLSIGGNDILAGRSEGGWYQNMDLDVAGSEQALFDQIIDDTQYIMDEVWSRARPDIKFVLSGYDFPNFNVTGSFLGQDYCGFYACPKREDLSRDADGNGSIDGSELMTDQDLNSMMNSVEQIRRDLAATDPLIEYDNGQGLMHYYYGFDDSTYPAISPGTTSKPLGVYPYTPGGDVNTPTDRDNFRTVAVCGLGSFPADPIHLDADAYEYKIKNQFDNIFFAEYRGTPDLTVFSDGATDGYVDTDDQTAETNGIRVGDDGWEIPFTSATNIYKGIFSFDTSNIPDNAEVTDVSLYVIRSGAADNPFEKGDRNAVLDIKNGFFGDNSSLDWTDGDAPADATNVACFNGLAEEDRFTVRADLNSGFEHINKTGFTQFRMQFDVEDWSTEYINFYDGGGSAAFLPPGIAQLQNPPAYTYRTVRREYQADGTTVDIEIERGPEIDKREGYVYQEKLKDTRPNAEGDDILYYTTVMAIEHTGLAEYMSLNHGSPGGGFAPFLDIKYQLVLPVDLITFRAEKEGTKVQLSWQTAAEQNSEVFIIEHSADSREWLEIGVVEAAGNSTELIDYALTHQEPVNGKNYYRLRSRDLDGTETVSEVRLVNFSKGAQVLEVYPNPFSESLSFRNDLGFSGEAEVEFRDILGRLVYSTRLDLSENQSEVQVNTLGNLQSGTYLLQLAIGNEVFFAKVIKE